MTDEHLTPTTALLLERYLQAALLAQALSPQTSGALTGQMLQRARLYLEAYLSRN